MKFSNNLKVNVNDLFRELTIKSQEESLSIESTKAIIKNSNLPEGWKEHIVEKIEEHKHCETETLEDEDKFSFVVATYGEENISLECECCYSVIIDSDIILMSEDQ